MRLISKYSFVPDSQTRQFDIVEAVEQELEDQLSDDQIEQLKRTQRAILSYLGRLTHLLHNKQILTDSDVVDSLLPTFKKVESNEG